MNRDAFTELSCSVSQLIPSMTTEPSPTGNFTSAPGRVRKTLLSVASAFATSTVFTYMFRSSPGPLPSLMNATSNSCSPAVAVWSVA